MTYFPHRRVLFYCLGGFLVLMACAVTSTVHANDYDDVNRLTQGGKLNEAIAQANQFLTNKPRDPQMRFLKGVAQLDAGQGKESIATFLQLTQDTPELPEPYNNLAVLYAADGQFDKARSVLESAIRINPDYATAHENLGDIYARMARNAYTVALQLEPGNSRASAKLAVMQTLQTLVPVRTTAPPPIKLRTVVANVKSGASPAVLAALARAERVQAVPVPAIADAVAAVATAPVLPIPAATLAASADPTQAAEVEKTVQGWAAAWTQQNIDAYLGSYGEGFVPAGGQSHDVWEAQQRARVVGKANISVDVQNLVVTFNGALATARFRQVYRTDALKVTSRKTLQLVRERGQWRIRKEFAGA